MTVMSMGVYALIGVFAGFSGGLFGIGGGLIVVPFLLLTFHYLGMVSDCTMQLVVGTSLGAMVFTSASSALAHYRLGGIVWRFFWVLSPGIIIGAICGAFVADMLPSAQLTTIFSIIISLIGIYVAWLQKAYEAAKFKEPNILLVSVLALGIGILSSIMGIGGGVMTVPALVAMHLPVKNAISTSAATGFLIALFGATAFFLLGLNHQPFDGCLGYLYLPAFLMIGVTSFIAAPFGAKMAYFLPSSFLKRLFGVFLIVIGVSMWLFK